MKSDDYKIPFKQQKLTELLPEELKQNIKASLLTPEQLKALSAEERFAYKQTQKKLAKVLREIGKTEAENQKLHGYPESYRTLPITALIHAGIVVSIMILSSIIYLPN